MAKGNQTRPAALMYGTIQLFQLFSSTCVKRILFKLYSVGIVCLIEMEHF